MDSQNFFTFKTFLQCIVIFIFTTFPNLTISLHPQFEACAPKPCGNDLNISYPFWISDKQASYCGYPNFEISCNDQNPVLTISNDDYIIKDIFYDNSSILLANSAAYENTCPTPLHNLTLVRTPFNKSYAIEELLFLYNCTQKPPKYLTYPMSCASNDTYYSFAVFHKGLLVNESYQLESCQSFVYAPVHIETGVDVANLFRMNYTDILKTGFLLNWTANNCSSCEKSGGRCGFDNNQFVCFCVDKPHHETCDDGYVSTLILKIVAGISAVVLGIIVNCIIFCIWRRKKWSSTMPISLFSRKTTKNNQDIESYIGNQGPLAIKRYSFSDVKKMTSSFKCKLGQGGYGGVYKGKLSNGRLVAVKLLNTSKVDGQEFINEVASISRTSHVNVVMLLGFCLEGKKRALIYEFMFNGSLEKFIYNKDNLEDIRHLGWEKLYQIAVGIARGLDYLHRRCNTRILHFDIKPHNILLDEDFCPKISDFGLAKLCARNESIISMLEVRGTIGYIAPEVFSRNFGKVSHKSDVYSYGMMVLEMVGGRKKINVEVINTSEIYFPHWIYRNLEQNEDFKWHGDITNEENEIVKKMIIVGLWCIQTHPSDRPSMNKVIEMLQGNTEDLQIPPKPFLSSPPRPPIDSCSTNYSLYMK